MEEGASAAKRQRTEGRASRPFPAAHAATKGRKLTLEDVPLVCPALDDAPELSFYAVLDGHGGRACAEWVAAELPALLAEEMRGATDSAAIKERLRACFARCDERLLERCCAEGWEDGATCIGMLVDRRCVPARAYVANLGDSRAFAAVVSPASAADGAPRVRAVALSRDHTAVDPKERKRIEAAGGFVEGGRVCGILEVSRSFGDRRLKRGGAATKGLALSIAQPDVTSFPIGPEQAFVVLACDGLWRAFSGTEVVEWLHARLPAMDARRAELAAQLDDASAAAALTKQTLSALRAERESADEEGCLTRLLHEAVHVRHAKDNCTVLLVRLARPTNDRAQGVTSQS
jgi:serine/threonine protein phosphatase PrpC